MTSRNKERLPWKYLLVEAPLGCRQSTQWRLFWRPVGGSVSPQHSAEYSRVCLGLYLLTTTPFQSRLWACCHWRETTVQKPEMIMVFLVIINTRLYSKVLLRLKESIQIRHKERRTFSGYTEGLLCTGSTCAFPVAPLGDSNVWDSNVMMWSAQVWPREARVKFPVLKHSPRVAVSHQTKGPACQQDSGYFDGKLCVQ